MPAAIVVPALVFCHFPVYTGSHISIVVNSHKAYTPLGFSLQGGSFYIKILSWTEKRIEAFDWDPESEDQTLKERYLSLFPSLTVFSPIVGETHFCPSLLTLGI